MRLRPLTRSRVLDDCKVRTLSMRRPSRQHVSTGSPFEPKVGISRAVRSGSVIAGTGTAPLVSDSKTVAKGNAAAQARRCFEIVQSAIEGLGGKLSDVQSRNISELELPHCPSRLSSSEMFRDCPVRH